MFSVRKDRPFWRLLAFRLSFWYAGLLAVSALVCFSVFYGLMISTMRTRTDADLLHMAKRLSDARAQGGMPAVAAEMAKESEAVGINDTFFRAMDRSGARLASSDLAGWNDMLSDSMNAFAIPPAPVFDDWYGTGRHSWVRVVLTPLNDDVVLQIGYSMQDDARVAAEFRRLAGVVLLGAVAAAAATGWFMARRALAGVQTIMTTARRISQGQLMLRVPISGRSDEIDQLAATFNAMLEQIASLLKNMKETNDNIAHELRSPVARIRGLAETTVTSSSTVDEYQALAATTIDQCDRLLQMINTMLDIAEAEGGAVPLEIQSVDLSQMARDAIDLYQPLADDKSLRVTLGTDGPCIVRGDRQRLQRALANLLDNAVKYTPPEGQIGVVIRQRDHLSEIQVSNTGVQLSDEDQQHLFERFYRGRSSRSQPGNGLGLSLAQAIFHAHKGRIEAVNSSQHGVVFTATLPNNGFAAPS